LVGELVALILSGAQRYHVLDLSLIKIFAKG